jgi:RimJ/RimL family protein N-acetyltransferase
MTRSITPLLRTERYVLTPLSVADAVDMMSVLADVELYTFTGGAPPNIAQLTARYIAQVSGSGTPDELWHNWIIRSVDGHEPLGFVQSTIMTSSADVAWVVGTRSQGGGVAKESAHAMCQWLRGCGVQRITAHIHPEHVASARVARACGLMPTNEVDDDGERVFEWLASSATGASNVTTSNATTSSGG